MTVRIYRMNDDRDGWNHIGTVDEDGEFTAHTEFAEEELADEIARYDLPAEEELLAQHYGGPYIRAEVVDAEE